MEAAAHGCERADTSCAAPGEDAKVVPDTEAPEAPAEEAPGPAALGGVCVGDAVRIRDQSLIGMVKALVPPSSALVQLPQINDSDARELAAPCKVELRELTTSVRNLLVVGRHGLRVGQSVAWRLADDDVPRGSSLRIVGFPGEEEAAVVCQMKGRCFSFAAAELLERRHPCGISAGDRVRWLSADEDLPEGSVGTVLGFRPMHDTVLVDFGTQTFAFTPEQLETVESRRGDPSSPSSSSDEGDGWLAPPMRPATYPFEGNHSITFDQGEIHVHLTDGVAPAKGVVIFCPGTHGGVGPCRTPGTNFDRDALFPTLAKQLAVEGIFSCRVCWSAMHPPMEEAAKGTVMAVHYALRQLALRGGPQGRVGVCLVGHSLGGAVVLRASGILAKVLPAMKSHHLGGVKAADLLAVCTLAAQERGSKVASKNLEGVPKLFLHGSLDAVLPVCAAERVFEAAAEPKELEILEGGEHDLFTYRAHLLQRVQKFLLDAFGGFGSANSVSEQSSAQMEP